MSKFNGEATQIEDNRNKTAAITGTEKDSNTYPTAKAVIDYVKGQVPSVDTDLSETSENPVQNKVITSHINMLDNTVRRKVDASQISNDVTETSIYIRIPTNEAVRNYVAAEIAKIAVYNGESENL